MPSNTPSLTPIGSSSGPLQSAAQIWQSVAEYQQTVAGIMNLRGQCADTLLQATWQATAQAAQCRTLAEWVGVWGQWHGCCLTQLTNLHLKTTLYRNNLWDIWQQQSAQLGKPSLWAEVQAPPTAKAPVPTAAAPTPAAPTVAKVAAPAVAAPVPTPVMAAPIMAAPVAPAPLAAAPIASPTPVVQGPMAHTNTQLPLPTISRTGDAAVVRSNGGATIAAAAATRRSVVARRSQRKSGLARAR